MYHVHGLEDSMNKTNMSKISILPKLIYEFDEISIKIPGLFCRN